LSGLKDVKVLVMADLTGRAHNTVSPYRAGSLVEQLNRLCGNVIMQHGHCDGSELAANKKDPLLPGATIALLKENAMSPSAAVMVGSSERDRQCAETVKLGMYLAASRFFRWADRP